MSKSEIFLSILLFTIIRCKEEKVSLPLTFSLSLFLCLTTLLHHIFLMRHEDEKNEKGEKERKH